MTLRVLVAGMAAGYAMALLTTAVLTYLLNSAMNSGKLDKWIDRGVPRSLVAVQILFATTAAWMLLGTALAALYLGGDFADGAGALGAPSLVFVGIVMALAIAPLPVLFIVNGERWWLWIGMAAVFVIAFGWILPLAGE